MPEPDLTAAVTDSRKRPNGLVWPWEDVAKYDRKVPSPSRKTPSPDLSAAVDAGARAWFDRVQAQRRDEYRKRDDGKPWQWEDLTAIDRHAYRSLALPIVTAVLATITEEETKP